MRRLLAGLLCLFLLPLVIGAALPPAPVPTGPNLGALQDEQCRAEVQHQMEETRTWLQERDVALNRLIDAKVKETEGKVRSLLQTATLFLPFAMFCSVLAAMELHDLLSRRRDRKYLLMRRTMPNTAEQADSAKTRAERKEKVNLHADVSVTGLDPPRKRRSVWMILVTGAILLLLMGGIIAALYYSGHLNFRWS